MIVVVRLVEVIHTNCMSVFSLWVVSFVVRMKWSGWPSLCRNIDLKNARNLYYSSACLSSYIGISNRFETYRTVWFDR